MIKVLNKSVKSWSKFDLHIGHRSILNSRVIDRKYNLNDFQYIKLFVPRDQHLVKLHWNSRNQRKIALSQGSVLFTDIWVIESYWPLHWFVSVPDSFLLIYTACRIVESLLSLMLSWSLVLHMVILSNCIHSLNFLCAIYVIRLPNIDDSWEPSDFSPS